MTNFIDSISQRKAAIVVGIAFITLFLLLIVIDDFVLSNFIVPGDSAKLASDIMANEMRFGIAVAGLLIILTLDAVIALALYVVLKPANKNLASLTAVLRLLYVVTLAIGVFALVFQVIDVYSYETMRLNAFIFFTAHLFVLGYSIFKSGYIPKILGVSLIIASFIYIIVFYANFLVPEALLPILMVPAAIAEFSIGIWLLLKRDKIPEMKL
ncbi:MAG: DUF4386 domain-containing protein [Proteobacteria bacterium]|nr:DUF4386 domain-containing protein [Pseudomonadota bacterium]